MSKAILVGVYQKSVQHDQCIELLEELRALGQTYGIAEFELVPCPVKSIDAKTFIGEGKVEEIRLMQGDMVIFDDEITPNQQKNLEKILGRPVIDRTELILEVFAQRAQTKEAKLQIELAKIRYELPRLKRMWTHLSRQSVGGKGYLKGEGEKQIEIDRRILKRRITHLSREIEEVQKHRDVQRQARLRSGIPAFAIVGYTNVGKSTLLKALTQADVLVEDKLFATLDTTTRKFTLPNHQQILLIDTVGFIRKLPHTIVAAFKSTLEESLYSDILLHLIDVSHPAAEAQAEATSQVLKDLDAFDRPIITVLNKVDKLENRMIVHRLKVKYPKTVAISATTREGFDDLMNIMVRELAKLRKVVDLRIPQSRYALVTQLMKEGKVLNLDYEGNDIIMTVEIPVQYEHLVSTYVVDHITKV